MAFKGSDNSNPDERLDQKAQEQNLALREALANAHAFVIGRQATQSFASLSFEDLADQQIERIEGAGTKLRPNELDRLDKIERDLSNAVAQIRALPPEAFVAPDEDRDVNTPA